MKRILITGICLCICSVAFCQDVRLFNPGVSLTLRRPDGYLMNSKTPVLFNFIDTTKISVMKSPVHYTAFFCRMEEKTVNKLGIWIKVHAGTYDDHERFSTLNR